MAVQFQDYYESLGVARTASPEEIKQAFRALARIHHPDVARNKVTGEARFKEINEAYEVLSDSSKRHRYDELGANWQGDRPGAAQSAPGPGRRGPPPAGPEFEFDGTGFSDFFSSFFGGGRSGFASHRFAAGAAGPDEPDFGPASRDLEADLLVTLEEALHGSLRKVTLRRSRSNGGEDRTNTYQVRLPPGVREGQRIRLAGQGGTRLAGGPAGDLYLRIRLARHPDFKVEASDLHCELDVAPWEAVLGVQVRLPALDGPTTLQIPPGTRAGRQLRLRGLGLPNRAGTRGDLYATVKIQIPASVTPEERALWEKLASVSQFKPRNEA